MRELLLVRRNGKDGEWVDTQENQEVAPSAGVSDGTSAVSEHGLQKHRTPDPGQGLSIYEKLASKWRQDTGSLYNAKVATL